jgi:hypothetical protein
VAIWTFLGISYLREKNVTDDNRMVEAFSQTAFANEESVISIDGEYTGEYLATEGAKALLASIATELGIDNNYEIVQNRNEQKGELVLTKKAKRAQTTLKFITVESNSKEDNIIDVTQYVSAEIDLYDTADCTLAYRNKLKDILERNQVAGDVTLSLKGKYPEELTLEEKNFLADDMLKKLDADVKTEQRSDDMYVIYGYSKYISEYKKIGNQKINVSLAMNYNEEEQSTYIYLSTPLINEDY